MVKLDLRILKIVLVIQQNKCKIPISRKLGNTGPIQNEKFTIEKKT